MQVVFLFLLSDFLSLPVSYHLDPFWLLMELTMVVWFEIGFGCMCFV